MNFASKVVFLSSASPAFAEPTAKLCEVCRHE